MTDPCYIQEIVPFFMCSYLTLCIFPLVQLHSGYAGAGDGDVPPHLEDDLIRLVLAEQLEGVANTLQQETRYGTSVMFWIPYALLSEYNIRAWCGRLTCDYCT